MPQSKKPKARSPKTDDEAVEKPGKVKKAPDFDGADPLIAPPLDEEETTEDGEIAEDAAEVPEFDPEEIDPFNDKWEE